jgi:hypothetical protein
VFLSISLGRVVIVLVLQLVGWMVQKIPPRLEMIPKLLRIAEQASGTRLALSGL